MPLWQPRQGSPVSGRCGLRQASIRSARVGGLTQVFGSVRGAFSLRFSTGFCSSRGQEFHLWVSLPNLGLPPVLCGSPLGLPCRVNIDLS